jgi:ribose 5-phosphate isomerase B
MAVRSTSSSLITIAEMRIGIAADHQGFALKEHLKAELAGLNVDLVDFGAIAETPGDDYPDYAIPLARAVAAGEVWRGLAICGSGVGICIAVNKVRGVRAGLCHDHFSAHQGVEDDDMNILCLGSGVIGTALAWELTQRFLTARFSGIDRHRRRIAEVEAMQRLQDETVRLEHKNLQGSDKLLADKPTSTTNHP